MAECGSNFPQVVGSLFLSPGGSKFIHLMYHFARFVAIKYIKSNSKSKMELSDDQSNIQEKIEKVRSLWASVTETLVFLEKEREVVSSVLNLANHLTLDGSNVDVNIPRLLLQQVEKQMSQAVDLLPPMSPLSFDPASEEAYAKSILLQYPASLPDTPKQHNQENDCRRVSDTVETVHDLVNSPASFLLQQTSSLDGNNVALLEKVHDSSGTSSENQPVTNIHELLHIYLLQDMEMRTPREKSETLAKKTPKFEVNDSVSSNITTDLDSSAFVGPLPAKISDPFEKEQDHLVEEVARAVLSDSPQLSDGKAVKLEDLIDCLASNPFLTRKQIPRTPEKLISEIRSSWRKAVEMEDNRSSEPIQMDTEHREVLPEPLPLLHNEREFSLASFLSATTESSNQSHLREEKVVPDCLKSVPQKCVVTSHICESTQNESDLLNKKVICKPDSEFSAIQNMPLETSQVQTFSPGEVANKIDVTGSSEEDYIKILDHLQTSNQELSMHKTMLWNSFQISSGIDSRSFKDIDFGILHETLPEELGHLSLNSSCSTEANFKLEPNSPIPSGNFPDDTVGDKEIISESTFSLQTICSRYEALKKALSNKREESHLSSPETLERHKLELSPTPQNMQTDDLLDILDTHNLHVDYTKPSLRMSLGERKRSLSPLIKFSPVEQRLRSTIPSSLEELLPNLKGKIYLLIITTKKNFITDIK
ncbi:HAUS augmin-like complex subunit 6 [Galemys pyrenaicus]|uniref:HAUS augmin-like complex subunit 6 n=1 Tax=Galemys pyrenaicus TaxID=202257 RepID=A0A8J6AMD7_GALPY|nr:HAUS augmin-like complex subunit 6 [Galemys pyrenaicus]